MGHKHGKSTGQLILAALQRVVNSKKLVCLVGYGLSEEAGNPQIPQFDGILKGVWSSTPGNINPFDNGKGQETVLSWINWRKQIINRKSRIGYFDSIYKLKQSLESMIVATQCVDGQLRLTDLPEVHELYGSIFGGRCGQCGSQEDSGKHISCSVCGGCIFPDVSMFGWNQKVETQRTVLTAVTSADAIILVGTDPMLAPLHELYATNYSCRILEVVPTGLMLSDHVTRLKATVSELSDLLKQESGIQLPPPGLHSIIDSLKFLTQLINGMKCGGL
jgi:NAD-dependent SIR2 family protein deacetylase